MVNEKLISEIEKIEWKKYPTHCPYNGLNILGDWKNRLFIETGGGGTAKELLEHIAKYGGKLITIDLCHKSKEPVYLKEKEVSLCGLGDYSSKKELYQEMQKSKEISKVWTYYNMDAYKFFETIYTGPIDYYYDDGTHTSDYLIPLFKDFILPRAVSGAIVGTDDAPEEEMQEFVEWLKNHEKIDEVFGDKNSRTLVVRIK